MALFKPIKKNEEVYEFNKLETIQEILDTKDERCPGWNFFKIHLNPRSTASSDYPATHYEYRGFNEIKGDLLAIYTDVITKEVLIKGNPFSEYRNTAQCAYQIVREIYITDQDIQEEDYIYKPIIAKSAKELFIKLKRELE